MNSLAGACALVTGAGRGLGRAVAAALAAEGADIALLARTSSELDASARDVEASGRRALRLVGDVACRDDVRRAVERATVELGPVDVLVNNAAIQGPIGPLVENDADAWERTIAVNLMGPVNCIHAVLPGMIERRRGTIVNVSGGGATAPRPGFSAYAASKAGVVRLTETLAVEVAPYGVRVNAVAPGVLPTRMRMLDELVVAGDVSAGDRERARQVGALERAVALVVYLVSDASGPLTGKLVSAPHDPWREWTGCGDELNRSSLYTLRRLDPFTLAATSREIA